MDSIEQNQEDVELLEEHTSSPLLSSSLTTVRAVWLIQRAIHKIIAALSPTPQWLSGSLSHHLFWNCFFLEFFWTEMALSATAPRLCEDTGPWFFKNRFMRALVTSQIISPNGFTPLGIIQWRKRGLWLTEECIMVSVEKPNEVNSPKTLRSLMKNFIRDSILAW